MQDILTKSGVPFVLIECYKKRKYQIRRLVSGRDITN